MSPATGVRLTPEEINQIRDRCQAGQGAFTAVVVWALLTTIDAMEAEMESARSDVAAWQNARAHP